MNTFVSAAQDGSRNQDKTSDSCSANSQTFNGAHDRLVKRSVRQGLCEMVCGEIHLQHSLKPCFSVYNCIFKELYLHVDWDLVLEVNITSAQKMRCSVTQSCLTLCGPMDYSLPGFSVHGISQIRILEWVAMPSSKGSSFLTLGKN